MTEIVREFRTVCGEPTIKSLVVERLTTGLNIMSTMLINASQPDELRIAVTTNGQLIDLDIEQSGFEQKKSNIYKGKISSIEPSLGAVFVNYGSERHGFLPLKEISKEYFLNKAEFDSTRIDLHKILKVGQEIVVQVEKEERGNKGAALTTFISLPGSFLVLMPNNERAGGISRRIEGEERDQLKAIIKNLNIPDGMGVIIRTACVGKTADELNWDLAILLKYWEAIKQAAVLKPGPYLIHQESDVIIRSIRDYLRHDIEQIIIDDKEAFDRAVSYLNQVRPEYIDRLNLYTNDLPLFSSFQIEQQIENAYHREVRLPSGGSIVIDHTEALVAIDINSARATKGSSIEETAYNTNLEASEEIARQMRLRDLGGLIVIDYIDMMKSSHQRDVENRLRQSTRLDRARIQIGRISNFGLLEMSRQRLRNALIKNTQTSCPRCHGRGEIRSVESLALTIIHLVEEQAMKAGSATVQVQLPVDISTYIMNEKRQIINDIQTKTITNIVIIANSHLKSPNYLIKLVKDDQGKHTPSYKQINIPKTDLSKRTQPKLEKINQPAIKEFLSTADMQAPSVKKPSSDGLLKKLWEIMFGGGEPIQKDKPIKAKHAPSATRTPPKNATPAKKPTDRPETRKSTARKPQNSSSRRGTRGGTQQRNSRSTEESANKQTTQSNSSTAKRTISQSASKPTRDKQAKTPVQTTPKTDSKAHSPQQKVSATPNKPTANKPKEVTSHTQSTHDSSNANIKQVHTATPAAKPRPEHDKQSATSHDNQSTHNSRNANIKQVHTATPAAKPRSEHDKQSATSHDNQSKPESQTINKDTAANKPSDDKRPKAVTKKSPPLQQITTKKKDPLTSTSNQGEKIQSKDEDKKE